MLILAIPQSVKTLVFIVALIAVFYFFMIRPQSQKAKEERQYRDSLKKGDKVMTVGGIHGVIHSVSTIDLQLEVAPGVRMTVLKSAIQPIPEVKQK